MKSVKWWLPVVVLVAALATGFLPYVLMSMSGKIPFALRDRPWPLEAIAILFAAFAVFLAVRAYRQKSARAAATIAATLATLHAAFFVLFVHIATVLPKPQQELGVGTHAPDFTLPDETGAPVTLASLRGHPALLVFYRGSW